MPLENAWKTFFRSEAARYETEVFTKNTLAEADFIVEKLGLKPSAAVLDVGCGTGRHSVELAKRGFRMTGIDLSPDMLNEARKSCQRAGASVELLEKDATVFDFSGRFDAALCLCEGAFGLLAAADDPMTRDLRILKNVCASLKPGGKFLLTALNGLRMARESSDKDVAEGRFDPRFFIQNHSLRKFLPEAPEDAMMREKGFSPSELEALLITAGFEVKHMGGGTAGDWGLRPVKLDEMELMAIAVKRTPD